MNNYCGFIEVWSNGKKTYNTGIPVECDYLPFFLNDTLKINGNHTVAIFKIKLKSITNE